MIKEVLKLYEQLESTQGHVNPIVNLSQENYEYINDKPLYIHFYNNEYNSIKLELSDNDYIITVYFDGFIYQLYTLDVSKIDTLDGESKNTIPNKFIAYAVLVVSF